MKTAVLLLISLVFTQSANALEMIVGRVITLEPTNMPSSLNLMLDAGNATCSAGTWLKWANSNIDNNKAVYSTLAAALVSGKQVRFYINNGDTTCKGLYVHLLDS